MGLSNIVCFMAHCTHLFPGLSHICSSHSYNSVKEIRTYGDNGNAFLINGIETNDDDVGGVADSLTGTSIDQTQDADVAVEMPQGKNRRKFAGFQRAFRQFGQKCHHFIRTEEDLRRK